MLGNALDRNDLGQVMISKNDVMVIFTKQRTSSGGLKMLYFMAVLISALLSNAFKANIRHFSYHF